MPRHRLVIVVAIAYAAQGLAQTPAEETLARYGSGSVRFTLEGKKYELPSTSLIDPETGKPRVSQARLIKFKDWQGGIFHTEIALLSITVRDVGEYPPEDAPVGCEMNLKLRGVFVTLGRRPCATPFMDRVARSPETRACFRA